MPSQYAKKVLIISHEFDPHVDYMVVLLQKLGVECLRWVSNSFPLGSRLNLGIAAAELAGELETGSWRADFATIRSVWYRHPAPADWPIDISPEERRFAEGEVRAAMAGLWQAFDWFWANHPDKVAVANSKILQLKIARELGFRIPRTLVTNDPIKLREFFQANGGNIIYKPFNSGFFAGSQKICYATALSDRELGSIDLIKTTPGIFQENIRKKVELRVTIIGRNVFAAEIHSQCHDEAKNDWREVEVEHLPHFPHTLPIDVERRCLAFLDRFGLAFGAMDLILTDDDEYVFLENNRSGQFGWIEAKTGMPLTTTLARMLIRGEMI